MKGVKEQRLLKDERGKPGELLAEARPAREESPNHCNAYVGIPREGGGEDRGGGRSTDTDGAPPVLLRRSTENILRASDTAPKFAELFEKPAQHGVGRTVPGDFGSSVSDAL